MTTNFSLLAPMRLLLELVLAIALTALSWNKSFKQWASESPVIGSHFTEPTIRKSVLAPATSATPPPKIVQRPRSITPTNTARPTGDAQGSAITNPNSDAHHHRNHPRRRANRAGMGAASQRPRALAQ